MTVKILISIVLFHFCYLSFAALDERDDIASLVEKSMTKISEKLSKLDDSVSDRARPDQKSLLIAFDTTGSMSTDLAQLRSGAEEIVRTFSAKSNDPIFNYVLSLFNDPTVEDPLITRDPEVLLDKLNSVTVGGGGDCPELAIRGLINALENGLKNSQAFLFSDASAKDYFLYDHVAALVQRKQANVNFLLTGNCGDPNSPEFKVYEKIARASGGQVFNMNRDNVRDVLVAMSVSLESDFVSLKSIDSDAAGSTFTTLELDDTIKRLSVSFSGRNAKLSINDSKNVSVTSEESFSSANIQIVTFDVTDNRYTIEASAESAFSMRIGGTSSLSFEFGFSRNEPVDQAGTYIRPIAGQKNVLSVFVSDSSVIASLESATIFLASSLERFDEFEVNLKFNNGFYSSDLFEIPEKMFRIRVLGSDSTGNAIDRVISTGIESISTMIPEVEIDYDTLSTEIYGEIYLNCIVKTLTKTNVTWMFQDKVLAEATSEQSSNLPLKVVDFSSSNIGNYSCVAENEVGRVVQQVTLTLKPLCKSECPLEGFGIIPSYMDCAFYYVCEKGIQYGKECPAGTVFDSVTAVCGDPETSVCASKTPCKD